MENFRVEEIVWGKVYSREVHFDIKLKPLPAGIDDIVTKVVSIRKNINENALVIWITLQIDIYFLDKKGALHCFSEEKPLRYVFFPEKIIENMEICVACSAKPKESYLSGETLSMAFLLQFNIKAVVERSDVAPEMLNVMTEKIVTFRTVEEQVKPGIARGFFECPGCTAIIAVKPYIAGVQARILKGMVVVEGQIAVDIFYQGSSGVERHGQIELPLEDVVACSEALPEQQARLSVFFHDVYCRPSRKSGCYDVIIGFELKVKVVERVENRVVTDFDREGFKVVKEDLLLKQVIDEGQFSFLRQQNFKISPPAGKKIDLYGRVQKLCWEVDGESLVVNGTIGFELFYLDESFREIYNFLEMEFSENHSLGKVESGTEFDVQAKILHLITAECSGEGVLIEALVEIKYTGFVRQHTLAVTDITPREGIERQLFQVDKILETRTFDLVENIEIPLEYPALYIEDIKGEIQNLDVTVLDHRFLICGELDIHMYYADPGGIVRCVKTVSPFGVLGEISGGTKDMQVRVLSRAEKVSEKISGPSLVEIMFNLNFNAEATRQEDLYLVTGTSDRSSGVYQRVSTDEKVMEISHIMPLSSPAIFIKEVNINVEKSWLEEDSSGLWAAGSIRINAIYTGRDNLVYQAFDESAFRFYIGAGRNLDGSRMEFTAKPRKILLNAGGEMMEGEYEVRIKACYIEVKATP
jgi:hypothetical protein